ncbi:hypothetical protein NP233_g1795 [Leucocoprinus birnbaumii]|uniref:Uncharacterized protein n=1 Tax=Leucocoprinus birnbaumii TaxID=56174 RepID=A0AAD5W3F0_9AGAR|nr:hypothetical protein NP233_g1795 [Leucocoprinus birnbaumii]
MSTSSLLYPCSHEYGSMEPMTGDLLLFYLSEESLEESQGLMRHQINLKTFYPIIAFLFEYLRRVSNPKDFDHPAHSRKILDAPVPKVRRASRSSQVLNHTVVLGEEHKGMDTSFGLVHWNQHDIKFVDIFKIYYQTLREITIPEMTTAICMTLLAEIYSTDYASLTDSTNGPKPCFRLEFGQSPISDFGICRGKIQSKRSCVQVWSYYDPRDDVRHTLTDPNNYYWIYFKTIRGDLITLDCCSYSFGMESFVDAGPYIGKLPSYVRSVESARIPAFFHTSQEEHRRPYHLVEEKRISVMHNKRLHSALSTRTPHTENLMQAEIIREFYDEVIGRKCTDKEAGKVKSYRMHSTAVLNEVLTGGYWREWDKPAVFRENLLKGGTNGWSDLQTLFKDSASVQAHYEWLDKVCPPRNKKAVHNLATLDKLIGRAVN